MKPILSSKVVRLNLVMLALGIITLAMGMPEFQAVSPWLVFVSGILNLMLRIFFTSEPITQFAEKS